MILLSALLASLSGLVAGERAPVRETTQVHASALVAAAETVAVAAVSLVAAWLALRIVAASRRIVPAFGYHVTPPRLRARLSLGQSWLE